MPVCEFCSQILSTPRVLIKHQKTARYCLEKQGNKICDRCGLSVRDSEYTEHLQKCGQQNIPLILKENIELKTKVGMLEATIKDYGKIIERQQKELARVTIEIGKKPTIVNNTLNIPSLPLSREILQNRLTVFRQKCLEQGTVGVKDYSRCGFEGRVVCTDYARRNFKFKNPDGTIVYDKGGRLIMKMLCLSISPKTAKYTERIIEKIKTQLKNVATKEELNNLGKKIEDASKLRNDILEGGLGQMNRTVREIRDMLAYYFHRKFEKEQKITIEEIEDKQTTETGDLDSQIDQENTDEDIDQDQENIDLEDIDQVQENIDLEDIDQDQENIDLEDIDQDQENTDEDIDQVQENIDEDRHKESEDSKAVQKVVSRKKREFKMICEKENMYDIFKPGFTNDQLSDYDLSSPN